MKRLLDFFLKFPHYDTVTGEINNCKKNSFSWFHEMRHVKQCKKTIYKNLTTPIMIYSQYISWGFAAIFLLDKNYNYALATLGIFTIPTIAITLILEFDAYLFGYLDYLKYKRGMKQ